MSNNFASCFTKMGCLNSIRSEITEIYPSCGNGPIVERFIQDDSILEKFGGIENVKKES